MKLGKRTLAGAAALCLCLSMLFTLPARAAEVTFTAINDSVLKLTDESMPIWSDGVLYTPYTTFDAAYNGVNWDIECIYTKGGNMVTVMDIDRRKFLEFNLREGTSCDGLSGEEFSHGAIIRNGQPYLPVRTVCDFFGLSYSYREVDQGSLLRIKNEDVVLNDRVFMEAAVNVLELRLQAYNQSQNQSVPQEPETSVVSPSVPEPENEQSVATYLAVRCEQDTEIPAMLSVLEGHGVHALFLVTPEIARQRGDLIVWMLGAGHSVGLLAEGESLEQTRSLLEVGSRALERQACVRTTVAGVPTDYRETLEAEGWVCWNDTLELKPGDNDGPSYFSRRTLNQLSGRTRSTYLSLEAEENALRILPTLLGRLEEEGFDLALPLETRL
ncbi:MAG: hypothetical protein IJZ52_03050 [Clostridium sp.]|nr:hypothetical protein [Clostridium sp.]